MFYKATRHLYGLQKGGTVEGAPTVFAPPNPENNRFLAALLPRKSPVRAAESIPRPAGINMPSQRVKLPLERCCLRAQTPQLAGVPILEGIPTHDTRAFVRFLVHRYR